jgi:hypothetical protein
MTLIGIPKHSEHYQEIQRKRLELMWREIGKYPGLHMLTDSRLAGPVLDEDVLFFKSEVLPKMRDAGVRCLAIVMPSNKFTQLTIKEMTQQADRIEVRYFDSISDATEWLQNYKDAIT